jgi:membrane protein YqaA with SNARE-associated domain
MNENAPKRIRIAVYTLKGCHPRPLDDGGMPVKVYQTIGFQTMTEDRVNSKAPEKKSGLKAKIIPVLTVLFVIAITVALFLFRDRVSELGNYGYMGIFLISLVSNATVILPVPVFMLIVAFGASFNPIFVGLTSALGGNIGEMSCYLLGYSGRGVVENRKMYDRAVQWLQKWGALTVFVFGATPSPFDVMGIVAGLLRYPFWKFFVASLAGKIVKYIFLAYTGAWGAEILSGGMNPVSITIIAALVVAVLLGVALFIEDWTWKRSN